MGVWMMSGRVALSWSGLLTVIEGQQRGPESEVESGWVAQFLASFPWLVLSSRMF